MLTESYCPKYPKSKRILKLEISSMKSGGSQRGEFCLFVELTREGLLPPGLPRLVSRGIVVREPSVERLLAARPVCQRIAMLSQFV